MNNKFFTSILLFALVVPVIMKNSLSPTGTPYLLFTLIFVLLFGNIMLDVFPLPEKKYYLLKNIILWLMIFLTIGSVAFASIVQRHKTAPVYQAHDIILQQESAIQFLLQGKNPYAVTYFGTPLENWPYSPKEINPALYHFVMQPFYLIFAFPFYFLSISFLGFFDGRLPLFFLFLILLYLGWKITPPGKNKLLFLTLLAFNPAMLEYTLEGRSDVFMYAFLFLGFYILEKKKYAFSGIPVALAMAIKQSAWPFFLIYVIFLFLKKSQGPGKSISLIKSLVSTLTSLIPFILTLAVIIGPFVLWDAKAYLDSTVFYLTGDAPHSYPISGYGFGMLLYEFNFIKDLHMQYPFLLWQLLFCLPALIFLFFYLKKSPTVKKMIFAYGVFLFIFWYFSRYFNNSHVGFLSLVFISACFWPENSLSVNKNKNDN